MISRITQLARFKKQLIMLLLDSALLVLILLVSFSIRLGYWHLPENDLAWAIFGSPIIAIPIFIRFGLYRSIVRYIGFKDVRAIVQAVSLYALIWGVVGFMAAIEGIPRSVIFINWILSLIIVGGLRILMRQLLNNDFRLSFLKNDESAIRKHVLIYGAGDAGVQLSAALEHTSEYKPVGFIDDSLELQGSQIRGLRIYSMNNISKLLKKLGVSEVLIAIPSISRARRLFIISQLESLAVVVRALPGVAEIAQGKIGISDLHKVNIVDLLGRDIVKPNQDLLSKNIANKVVMVTGAGGSIGSELCRQIINLGVSKLILFEQSELALYKIDQELSGSYVFPVLGSVVNKDRVEKVCKKFCVETIYHAAAYKHVPMVEYNNTEGVVNNILGTLRCAQAAINCHVEAFVLISTDKAVRPTNTMGATKRVAELTLQALAHKQINTIFTMVRFGNVLGSSGSVIPLFKQQIKKGGPITVTDKDVVRYFMTIHESVELVIQAGAMGKGGDVFVLDMGEPVRIDDLAKKMIHLSGLEVKDSDNINGDIEIKYTGLRPGEKLYEELLIGDNVSKTNHALIMRAKEDMLTWEELGLFLDDLNEAVKKYDPELVRSILIKIVPGFNPQCEISDLLYQDKL